MIEQRGRLEISRSRLRHNLEVVRGRLSPGVKICAVVKANAYGHGVSEVTRLVREEGVEWLAVYSLEEALDAGASPWVKVLVLAPFVLGDGPVAVEMARGLRGQVRINITDSETAKRLSAALVAAEAADEPVNVHVQVDTGLTRSGVDAEAAAELAEMIAGLPGLRLEGMFAHFSHGDVPGHESIAEQVRNFHRTAAPVKKKHPHLMVHVQNSGGVWNMTDAPPAGLDMVRVGIALYGLQPSPPQTAAPLRELQPIARVTAPILAIHERAAGTGVGYGHLFVTKRASRLAIVPVGYAEGYPRAMSNRGVVQVREVDAPVVGRVSMDQIVVDVTDVVGAKVGDLVMVISWDPTKANCVDRIAEATGTIGYEVATGFGGRLKRVVVE